MKKANCSHKYEDGATAWRVSDMMPELYQVCGMCHEKRYAPGKEPPKPKRTRKPKVQALQLITLPPPSRHTITLPDGVAVHHGLCLDVLKTLPDASVDAIVTDPPSGIAFMGKKWDRANGGRDAWIAEREEEFTEALRVLKPGAYAIVWALPRTSHWTMTALEDAGFEIRDVVHHLFGSGNPKGLDISKAIDQHFGAERKVLRDNPNRTGRQPEGYHEGWARPWQLDDQAMTRFITAAATPEAARFEGFNTALKPACEHWVLCQKPREGTYAENVLTWGTGGLNIKDSRVGSETIKTSGTYEGDGHATRAMTYREDFDGGEHVGRWPAHLVLSHTPECKPAGTKRVKAHDGPREPGKEKQGRVYGAYAYHSTVSHDEGDGLETVEAWECADGCPVAELDRQSGTTSGKKTPGTDTNRNIQSNGSTAMFGGSRNETNSYDDEGGASRFFTQLPADTTFRYFAKPSRAEREKGLADAMPKTAGEATNRQDGSAGLNSPQAGAGRTGGARNFHPTVKSVALMKWLITLVAPPTMPGEDAPIILDMFAGSGTTGVACIELGLRCILIEADLEDEGYIDLIYGRIDYARQRTRKGLKAA